MKTDIDLVTVDSFLLDGLMVFKGTRVAVESLFDHLDKGYTSEDFLRDFPTVLPEQVPEVLKIGRVILKG